ncbi:MAG TPA: hypothetical protein VEZ12_09480 [Herpetosiphonaceae bacterium]|nr:hypothetical protein [Herpetosiphonaceae bacterium]
MRLARHTHLFAFLSLVAVLCLVEIWLVQSAWFPLNTDVLALAVTVDLTLGISALYYTLVVRARHSPAITLLPMFIVAILLARLILPSSGQMYLDRVEYLLPLVEGCALVYGLLKARTVARHYRQVRPTAVYAGDALEAGLRHTFGSSRMIGLLVTELSIPYYVVFGWFRSFKNTNPANVPISCHRRSGYGAVIGMFTAMIVLETIGLHLVIQHWSATAAWILTAVSIYSLLWIIGDYHAIRLHPIVLGTQALYIRTGLRWRVDVDWTNIADVRRMTPVRKPTQGFLNAAVYGEPRFVLQLKKPVIAYGLFGMQKHVSQIGLTVDDETLFLRELNKRLCD